ncbi:MAG: cytochrome c biogenesis protein CcsA [Anaerolineae bacterium]|nr:cytochrome c biogenesis protein CcsA [Anaerolineae bacterium]
MQYSESRTRNLRWLTYASIGLFIISFWMIFSYVGPERTQGEVQRIFYTHLGAFFASFVLFVVALIAGIQYLRTRHEKWDDLGLSAIELGLIFSLINIVTGAIWARPIWNTWWTWDPRLTTVAIMWLAYAAYLMLRAGIEDPNRRRRFAAVYSILAFSSVFLTIIIIRVRPDTIHPVVAGPTSTSEGIEGDFAMSDRITTTLLFTIFTYVVISITLLWHRIRLENRTKLIQARKMKLLLNA